MGPLTLDFLLQVWEERATEAHMTFCHTVPDHIKRLWTTGTSASTPPIEREF